MNTITSKKHIQARHTLAAAGLLAAGAAHYLVEVSSAEHSAVVREHERSSNAGCLTSYDPANDRTRWHVGGKLVGVSEGILGSRKRYWAAVNLTPEQHAMAVDQVSNNDVSGDEEMIDHFFFEGRIPRADAMALLIERNRCLAQPFFEPLQDRYSNPAGAAH